MIGGITAEMTRIEEGMTIDAMIEEIGLERKDLTPRLIPFTRRPFHTMTETMFSENVTEITIDQTIEEGIGIALKEAGTTDSKYKDC